FNLPSTILLSVGYLYHEQKRCTTLSLNIVNIIRIVFSNTLLHKTYRQCSMLTVRKEEHQCDKDLIRNE
ncbi:hypothetical protein, partial [Salmonella sp. s55004]|uniref:hypothetical protein n=1 Tax=Salmonella sp. s55004 TaxID=3159675 RepID=UPI00397F092D